MHVHREHIVRFGGKLPARVALTPHDGVNETSVPVIDSEEVVKKRDCSNEVWVIRVPLGAVQESPEAVDFHETKTSEY